MREPETALECEDRHILEGEMFATRQERLIKRMTDDGDYAGAALGRALLATVRHSLQLGWERRQRLIRAD